MTTNSNENIYQKIWSADQRTNGIPAVLQEPAEPTSQEIGYVLVNEVNKAQGVDRNRNILSKVVLPEAKKKTYDLCEKLYDNYFLEDGNGRPKETTSDAEQMEIDAFMDAIIDTEPMKVCRAFIAEKQGNSFSDEEWKKLIDEMWFRFFRSGSASSRSGFEHVFVGEKKGSKIGGYHFWYKYYQDDNGTPEDDNIVFQGAAYDGGGSIGEEGVQVPDVVTLSYGWKPDGSSVTITKSIGGFFVGCSPEGLIALGMAQFYDGVGGPVQINNATYRLKLFKSGDGRSINTFYPEFVGKTSPTITPPTPPTPPTITPPTPPSTPPTITTPPFPFPPTPAQVFIAAALINAKDEETGEWVSIANYSPVDINLEGWTLSDRNSRQGKISTITIKSGDTARINPRDSGIPLSNKRGILELKDRNGNLVDRIEWTRKPREGMINVFNPFD